MTQSDIKFGLSFMAPNPIIERKPEKFNILQQIKAHNSKTEKNVKKWFALEGTHIYLLLNAKQMRDIQTDMGQP